MSERIDTENHREHLANQTKDGKRIWIYPKIIKGVFYKYRTYFSWFLLVFFFAAPFIKIGGYPLLLLNVVEGNFVIFGQPFWPQDFIIFVFLMLTFLVFIVLFTVVFGRVWCGWACPQTIFMEMVFRKIENFIEGNANKQRKLDEMPWNREKILKKGTKHSIFFLISFAISHTFLAYIIGVDQLWAKISGSFAENYATFIGLFIFSVVFYLVFAKLRELVCIMICPYGRLQGVMLDPNSLVVAYDYIRGEPRGKIRKKENQENKGDCVECHLCVDVCPTGIDIRNGTQLECVNCTACMDACDSVMEKIDKPKGLIRIDSKNNIEEKQGFKLTGRVKAYAMVMILLLGASITILATRTSIEANVLKIPGMTYSKTDDGSIINMFNLTLVNKTFEDQVYSINMGGELGELTILDSDSVLQANSEVKKVFMIIIPRDELKSRNTKVPLEIYCNGELTKDLNINFLGP